MKKSTQMPPKKAATKTAAAKKPAAKKSTTSSVVKKTETIEGLVDAQLRDEKRVERPDPYGQRMFGEYDCPKCKQNWFSGRSYANRWQKCMNCGEHVMPKSLVPLKPREEGAPPRN